MSIGQAFRFPPDKWEEREKLRKLSWLSVVMLLIATAITALSAGQSQAMKTAWISDFLTAVPPMALLVALRYEQRKPTERFPEGYARSISVAFLVTAIVLTMFGLYLLFDSVMKLVRREHPPIGTIVLFGRQVWLGWVMIGALFASAVIGWSLGKLKTPVADKLHSKALRAEADMNRAEWLSEAAAIIGISLVAFGLWWGDAAAAAFISVEIVRDGWKNIRQVIGDMMDESPTKLGDRELEPLPKRLRDEAKQMPWVKEAAVRLREHGHTVTGEVFVVPRGGVMSAEQLIEETDRAAAELERLDWRLHGLMVIPVRGLDDTTPPRLSPHEENRVAAD
jgi:cation diffusion facilitator family transporter